MSSSSPKILWNWRPSFQNFLSGVTMHIFLRHNPSVYRTPPSFRQNCQDNSIPIHVSRSTSGGLVITRANEHARSRHRRQGAGFRWPGTRGEGRGNRQGENKVPLARRSEPIFIKVSDSIKRLGWFLEGISTLHPMGIGGDRLGRGGRVDERSEIPKGWDSSMLTGFMRLESRGRSRSSRFCPRRFFFLLLRRRVSLF